MIHKDYSPYININAINNLDKIIDEQISEIINLKAEYKNNWPEALDIKKLWLGKIP